jgi:hypothetical protein
METNFVEFYATLLEGEQTGRACIEEGYPSEAQFFSDGTFNDQFWECSDGQDGTVEIEEWDPTEGGTWEQVGEAWKLFNYRPKRRRT